MSLSTSQLQSLKTAILAETDPTFAEYRTNGQTPLMAAWLNGDSTFVVWRSATRCSDILGAITWASFTPADNPDSTTLYMNRALVCQLKRDNLWCMLARDSINTATTAARQNLTDALQNVPAGVGGALLDAGWLGAGKVKATISRFASRAEKIFASGTGSSGIPGVLGWEGLLTDSDISAALEA